MILTADDIEHHNGIVTTNMSFRIDSGIYEEYPVCNEKFFIKQTLGKYGLWIVYECFLNDTYIIYVHIPVFIFDSVPETRVDHLPNACITTFLLSAEVFSFKYVSIKDEWSFIVNNFDPKNLSYVNRHIFGQHWKELVEGIGARIIMDYSK